VSEEPHAVVRLLLKRIESHPEEFKRGRYRWADIVKEVDMFGFDADTDALDAALRDVRLTEAHEEMMEELLNGEDRRRMEAEYESSMAISQLQQLQHSQQLQQNSKLQSVQQLRGYQGANIANASTITATQLETTLSTSTINAIKKALKL